MVFKFWSEGTEKSFILMLAPARDKGVTFLKIGREMWNYIPRINRVIKIPPSMMLQSWMGSDFTNDDLVKESSVVDDYTHEFLGREEEAGFDAYKVALTPKPTAPVVWAKIVEWIRVDDYVPLKAEYYNERGELIRTLVFLDIEEMGGRTISLTPIVGDPFVDKHIFERLDWLMAQERITGISFYTNAILMDAAKSERLMAYAGKLHVHVSWGGFDSETWNTIMGVRKFEQARDAVLAFLQIQERTGSEIPFTLALRCPQSACHGPLWETLREHERAGRRDVRRRAVLHEDG